MLEPYGGVGQKQSTKVVNTHKQTTVVEKGTGIAANAAASKPMLASDFIKSMMMKDEQEVANQMGQPKLKIRRSPNRDGITMYN